MEKTKTYIEITKSVYDALKQNNRQIVEKIFLCCAYTAKKGSHCICTDTIETAKSIRDYYKEKNNQFIAIIFDYIYNKFSICAAPKKVVIYYVSVGNFDSEYQIVSYGKGRKEIKVSLNYAQEYYFWDETFFLPENITDCDYYRRLIEYQQCIQANNTLRELNFSFRKEQGGGGKNTFQVFQARRSEKSFVLAFIDSDKKFPSSEFGDTAKQFLNKEDKIEKNSEPFVVILKVREIENLFSSDKFLEKSKYSKKMIDNLHTIEKKTSDIRLFFDFKLGIKYKDMSISYLHDVCGIQKKPDKCEQKSIPCGKCKEKCKEIIFQGSGKYISVLFENLDIEDFKDFSNFVTELHIDIKKEWQRLFMYFISACCSKKFETPGL